MNKSRQCSKEFVKDVFQSNQCAVSALLMNLIIPFRSDYSASDKFEKVVYHLVNTLIKSTFVIKQ